MSRFRAIAERPRLALGICLALTLAAAPGWCRLGFEQDLTNLFPQDVPEIRAFTTYRDVFGGGDTLLLLCRSPHGREHLLAAGETVAGAVAAALPETRVRYRLDESSRTFMQDVFARHAFAYLSADALADVRATLTPDGIRAAIAAGARRLDSATVLAAAEAFAQDPLGLGERVFLPAFRRSAGTLVDLPTGAWLSRDGTALLVTLEGRHGARDARYARRVIADAEAAVVAARASLAARGFPSGPTDLVVTRGGGYFAAFVNEHSIKWDLILTTVTGTLGVLLLFALAFPPRLRDAGSWRTVLARLAAPHVVVMVPLLLGIAWTAGLAGWTVGNVSAITAGFITVLVGLGVDFPIHLLARFRDERGTQADGAAAATTVSVLGPGLLTAALTTAGAFAILSFSQFRAFVELGALGSAGLLLCLWATLATVAPLYPRVATTPRDPARSPFRALAPATRGRALGICVAAALGTIAAGTALATRGVHFEDDLRRLATPNAEAVATAEGLGAAFGVSFDPILLVTRGPDAAAAATAAARVADALEARVRPGDIASVLGPGALCPSPERVRAAAEALRDADPDAVIATTRAALDAAGFDPEPFAMALEQLRSALAGSRAADLAPARLLPGPLDEVVRAGAGGAVAVTMVQPRAGLPAAGREALLDAAAAAAATDPGTEATSGDRLVAHLRDRLLPELPWLGGGAWMTLLVIVWFHFRHPGRTAAALLPLVLAVIWTGGAMAALGLPLTFFNVCAMPLLLGIGVDDGIHTVGRWHERTPRDLPATMGAVGMPVVMTSLTTMMGFGSLALASNRGLVSLGVVTSLGVGLALLASLVVLPAVLRLAHREPQA